MSKPRVIARPVADRYAAPGERIIEIASDVGGCLLSIRYRDDQLVIEAYRCDPTIVVGHGGLKEQS